MIFTKNVKKDGATRLCLNGYNDYDNGNGMDYDSGDVVGRAPLRESNVAFTLSDLFNQNITLQVNGQTAEDLPYGEILNNISNALSSESYSNKK